MVIVGLSPSEFDTVRIVAGFMGPSLATRGRLFFPFPLFFIFSHLICVRACSSFQIRSWADPVAAFMSWLAGLVVTPQFIAYGPMDSPST